jgi:O-acetyl-ADP-ribose deacetylase (regulator of RNase III)
MSLHYVQGDATKPVGAAEVKIIPHVCNSLGKWGAGFVLAVSKVYPEAEKVYRNANSYELGSVQFVECGDVVVANMIAQWGIRPVKDGSKGGCPPLRYSALFEAMEKVAKWVESSGKKCEIHGPKFGAGLAGGDWRVIEAFIKQLWGGLEVYIYTPPGQDTGSSSATGDDVLGDIFGN